MKSKLTKKEYIFVASMLFGMFFGAGNLIFPAQMGQLAGSAMIPAVIGFCITGVGLPLLGIASMGISKSEGLFDMGLKVGKPFAYFFTCVLYLSIGPLFAIPRTATVSYQIGIFPFIPKELAPFALPVFSFIFFAVVLAFSLKPSGILTWIGKVLNPLFLLFLGIMIVTSFLKPMGHMSSVTPIDTYAKHSFFTGFLEGYNTMDALAALAFGIILINVIRDLGIKEPKDVSGATIKAGCFSIAIMALIYCSLTVMGAQSRNIFGLCSDGGEVLHSIATHYFSGFGGILLGITITFACLKTSIALVTSCATTFEEMFPNSISYKAYAVIFSVVSFGIANIGLNNIIAFSVPVLLFLYPLTIVLILLGLLGGFFHYEQRVFVCTMTLTGFAAVLDFVHALPKVVQHYLPFFGWIETLRSYLPFSDIGMGWIVPAVMGVVIGILFHRCISKAC